MIHGKRLVVVMPAYNAAATVERTVADIPAGFVDDIVLVDDASRDNTADVAERLGLRVLRHPSNRGYGGNQKTCYREALRLGADVVVMLHPDYQYSPKLAVAMASMIAAGQYDVVLGSRILGGSALGGGMPMYKYVMNRLLTLAQNLMMNAKVSEYHTGYRAFSGDVLRRLPLEENSDELRVRQRDARPGVPLRVPRRGGVVPDPVRAGVVVDQPASQRQVRVRRAADDDAIPARKVALGEVPHLRRRRPPAAGGRAGVSGRCRVTTLSVPFNSASDAPATRPTAGDACIACGGSHFHPHLSGLTDYLTGESFDILRCAACDLLVTAPPPADAGRYYPAAYRGNRHAFTGRWRVRRRATATEACFPTGFRGRLLDVGAGDGSFAVHMRRRGWTVAATEIDPAAVGRLRAADVDAKQPAIAERDGFGRPFDAVTSWHVLEHVEHPARTVGWVRSQLAADGVFQATVPNAAALQARLAGRHWMHLDVPRHRQHFTPADVPRPARNRRVRRRPAKRGSRWSTTGSARSRAG